MQFSFERVGRDDLALLASWRAAPRVKRWWPDPHDLASLEREFQPLFDGVDPMLAFICSVDDRPMGFVQAYRLADEPGWRATIAAAIGEVYAVGIDYFIGEAELAGRGLGSQMIGEFVQRVWIEYADVASVVVAVQRDNPASWRALERSGFERVWEGNLLSDDPSDQGPAYIYVMPRPR
jgi:aminoglycoside 6'-N-acetyltransferase